MLLEARGSKGDQDMKGPQEEDMKEAGRGGESPKVQR